MLFLNVLVSIIVAILVADLVFLQALWPIPAMDHDGVARAPRAASELLWRLFMIISSCTQTSSETAYHVKSILASIAGDAKSR